MALKFIRNPTTIAFSKINTTVTSRCRKYKGFYPSFTPEISYMSITTSVAGKYSFVSIRGQNFLPNGTTYVNFGGYTNIPVTYGSSFNIAFVVPTVAVASVQVFMVPARVASTVDHTLLLCTKFL